jgi:hypothetical protein
MHATVVVESLYHREQFDDWVGGGELLVGSTTCRWSAYNSNNGFGWEIEPVAEEHGWSDLSEEEAETAVAAIERVLRTHRYEYSV